MRDGMPTSHVMGHTPYVEASVGIYNIFKLLHIEYVRRLTYTDIPGVKKGGVRFMILMIFSDLCNHWQNVSDRRH